MPDDQILTGHASTTESLKEIVPPVLIALGAISLLRSSRLLSLVAIGAYLYDAAVKTDTDRKKRGRDLPSRRAMAARLDEALDEEIADSFPASDPMSFSGTTAGAP
jgi:hypothetical protein